MAFSDERQDKFGELLISVLKNNALSWFDVKCSGEGPSPQDRIAYQHLSQLPAETVEVIKDSVNDVISNSIYDLLEKLQQLWEDGGGVELLIDGTNIFEINDEVKMNLFGEDRWEAKFGKYPSADQLGEKYDKWYNKLRREGKIDDK